GQFWPRRVKLNQGDLPIETLARIDAIAYSSLHVLRHVIDRSLLTYHVYEVAVFLHRSAADTGIWEEWFHLHDASLRRLEAIAFRFAREWFGCDLSPRAEEGIASLPAPIQRWFERYSRAPIYAMFRPNKHAVWLHLALIEDRKDRRSAVLHGLLPIRGPKVAIFAGMEEQKDTVVSTWKTCSSFLHYTL